MDGMMLLQEARAAGLSVQADGGQLVIAGPRRLSALGSQLLKCKTDVMQTLRALNAGITVETADPSALAERRLAAIGDADVRADLRYAFEERAAICEFDGRLSRRDAESVALGELILACQRWQQTPRAPRRGDSGERLAGLFA